MVTAVTMEAIDTVVNGDHVNIPRQRALSISQSASY